MTSPAQQAQVDTDKQQRRGPAPFASFEDLNDDGDSPDEKQRSLIRLPGIHEDVTPSSPPISESVDDKVGGVSLIGSLQVDPKKVSPARLTPSAPRIDISQASSSSNHGDSKEHTPDQTMALGFREEGRTSRLSSIGSQGSDHSRISNASRLSVTSTMSRSTSPHKMLLETSFCGSRPNLVELGLNALKDDDTLEKVLLSRQHDPREAILAEGITVKVLEKTERKDRARSKEKERPSGPAVTMKSNLKKRSSREDEVSKSSEQLSIPAQKHRSGSLTPGQTIISDAGVEYTYIPLKGPLPPTTPVNTRSYPGRKEVKIAPSNKEAPVAAPTVPEVPPLSSDRRKTDEPKYIRIKLKPDYMYSDDKEIASSSETITGSLDLKVESAVKPTTLNLSRERGTNQFQADVISRTEYLEPKKSKSASQSPQLQRKHLDRDDKSSHLSTPIKDSRRKSSNLASLLTSDSIRDKTRPRSKSGERIHGRTPKSPHLSSTESVESLQKVKATVLSIFKPKKTPTKSRHSSTEAIHVETPKIRPRDVREPDVIHIPLHSPSEYVKPLVREEVEVYEEEAVNGSERRARKEESGMEVKEVREVQEARPQLIHNASTSSENFTFTTKLGSTEEIFTTKIPKAEVSPKTPRSIKRDSSSDFQMKMITVELEKIQVHQPMDDGLKGQRPMDDGLKGHQAMDDGLKGHQAMDDGLKGLRSMDDVLEGHQPMDSGLKGHQIEEESKKAQYKQNGEVRHVRHGSEIGAVIERKSSSTSLSSRLSGRTKVQEEDARVKTHSRNHSKSECSREQSREPSTAPSREPSRAPSREPSREPSRAPSREPSREHSREPSRDYSREITLTETAIRSSEESVKQHQRMKMEKEQELSQRMERITQTSELKESKCEQEQEEHGLRIKRKSMEVLEPIEAHKPRRKAKEPENRYSSESQESDRAGQERHRPPRIVKAEEKSRRREKSRESREMRDSYEQKERKDRERRSSRDSRDSRSSIERKHTDQEQDIAMKSDELERKEHEQVEESDGRTRAKIKSLPSESQTIKKPQEINVDPDKKFDPSVDDQSEKSEKSEKSERSEAESEIELITGQKKRKQRPGDVCTTERVNLMETTDSMEDEELPYVPTTLPIERSSVVPLVPQKQRSNLEMKISTIGRPRSAKQINPSSIDDYYEVLVPERPSTAGEKIKISLPGDETLKRLKKDRAGRKGSNIDQKAWSQFAEQGLHRNSIPNIAKEDEPPPPLPPRQPTPKDFTPKEWINFEEIPEKKKVPKRIQTIPTRSKELKDEVVYNYVNPEECQCECHEANKNIMSAAVLAAIEAEPLLQDDDSSDDTLKSGHGR